MPLLALLEWPLVCDAFAGAAGMAVRSAVWCWDCAPRQELLEWPLVCDAFAGAAGMAVRSAVWCWDCAPRQELLEWLCGVLYGAGTALPARSCGNGLWFAMPFLALLEWLCGVLYGAGTALPGRSCWNGCAECAMVLGLRSPAGVAGMAVRSAVWCWDCTPCEELLEWPLVCDVFAGAAGMAVRSAVWCWNCAPCEELLEWLCGVRSGAGTALPARSCWNGCAECAMVLGLRSPAGIAGMAVRSAVWCWDCAPCEELLEWLCGVRYGAGTALPGRSCWNSCAECAMVLGLHSPGGAAGMAVRSALWCWDCAPRQELLEWLCGVRYGAGTALPGRSCWNGCAGCAVVLGLRSPEGVAGMAVRGALWCWDCAPREDFGSCL
uniref:uncharacterized protein LOC114671791 n=1 Tax=Macaca mulatta TaxID=9544 RepID=UPI0010A28405|nr:uncharacterized protein LOC114671791 [Macaca mulatta]